MASASIPVDVYNPGQVFACLGFLEAAEDILGGACCRFDWSDERNVRFLLESNGPQNPIEAALSFAATAHVEEIPLPESAPRQGPASYSWLKKNEKTALPICLKNKSGKRVILSHWCDRSGRESLKLYAGNRSALSIAKNMIEPEQPLQGIRSLWSARNMDLLEDPFLAVPMGGSFNFDSRSGWTGIDTGYSLNDVKDFVSASPVVELFAAWGLQNARPAKMNITRGFRYAIWDELFDPALARAAFAGAITQVPLQIFRFTLLMAGKNKITTIASRETQI